MASLVKFIYDKFLVVNSRHPQYEPIRSGTPIVGQENQDDDLMRGGLSNIPNNVPVDRYKLVYWIFLIQGLAMLLPWNAFITSSEFFRAKFSGSPYAHNFQNYFSIGFTLFNLIFFGQALYTQRKADIFRRIVFSLIINVLVFSSMAISTLCVDSFSPSGYFYFSMCMLLITGATTSWIQNGIFALASQFAPIHMQAVMSGQGVAGITVSITQIMAALATETSSNQEATPTLEDLTRGAKYYFVFTLAVAVAALISFSILIRLPTYHYYTFRSKQQSDVFDGTNSTDSSITEQARFLSKTLNRIPLLACAVLLAFVVTLALFPSITASIKSVVKPGDRQKFQQDYLFIPIHFLIFNGGDLIGRNLPGLDCLMIASQRKLAIFSLFRLIFVPIFLTCNVDAGNSVSQSFPLLIKNDMLYFSFLMLFAVTGGYLGSSVMMAGPQMVPDNERDIAGGILGFSLILGLVVGSAFSFLARAVICECNPFLS
ncbi:8081_t:CDS:2 [Ambispora gerdemannii]|uniref:8081_t:CDS:1 n=1 Tax=Ambispora gerdemannii TaxID=144530 RepID=A0A9N8ZBC9_9GLOM|nr:8081_t:CDS:2 [Ambispora gerdemannii]